MAEIPLSDISRQLIAAALAEDIGSGDLTTLATVDARAQGSGLFLAKQSCVVCGHHIAAEVLRSVDPAADYKPLVGDGEDAPRGGVIAAATASLAALLSAERTALNFLQRLSGIASLTRSLVRQVEHTGVKLLDTRKTTPGWRELEKYAVRCGGGHNHRQGLFDEVLIKNNHIDALGGDIGDAIRKCRIRWPDARLEVEVRNWEELRTAVANAPDAILLDNMTPDEIREALAYINAESGKYIESEASGGIGEKNVRAYAETGVTGVSLGMLTHSVTAADIAFRISKL